MDDKPYQPLKSVSQASPPLRRFQFTIKGLLWSTFWAAIACTAWGQLAIGEHGAPIMYLVALVALIAPWGILAALHEDMKNWMLTGLLVLGCIFLAVVISWGILATVA